jgi:hypothetical protein
LKVRPYLRLQFLVHFPPGIFCSMFWCSIVIESSMKSCNPATVKLRPRAIDIKLLNNSFGTHIQSDKEYFRILVP